MSKYNYTRPIYYVIEQLTKLSYLACTSRAEDLTIVLREFVSPNLPVHLKMNTTSYKEAEIEIIKLEGSVYWGEALR